MQGLPCHNCTSNETPTLQTVSSYPSAERTPVQAAGNVKEKGQRLAMELCLCFVSRTWRQVHETRICFLRLIDVEIQGVFYDTMLLSAPITLH